MARVINDRPLALEVIDARGDRRVPDPLALVTSNGAESLRQRALGRPIEYNSLWSGDRVNESARRDRLLLCGRAC